MPTTVQISGTTRQLLGSLKANTKKTFDEVIKELAEAKMGTPRSLFGEYPSLRWKKTDRMLMKER